MPEDTHENPYEILMDRIQKQEERITALEKENKEVIEFNKALLSRNGTQRSTKEVDSDADVNKAKDKLNKYLEEN